MCKVQGMTLSSNALDSKSKDDIKLQIKSFAQAWTKKNGKPAIVLDPDDDDLAWFTNKFVDWVNKALAAEGTA
jgi:hypothetical protein